MGLFSKLLGLDKSDEKILEKFVDAVKKEAGRQEQEKKAEAKKSESTLSAPAASVPAAPAAPASDAPSGLSWGEVMPAEENQFNFNGPFTAYFEKIFREEFPEYQVSREVKSGKQYIYTFKQGEKTALMIELLASSSEARKVRNDCRRAGIPYLRYYFDHEGWWNTRRYVADRTRAALKG